MTSETALALALDLVSNHLGIALPGEISTSFGFNHTLIVLNSSILIIRASDQIFLSFFFLYFLFHILARDPFQVNRVDERGFSKVVFEVLKVSGR